MLQFADKNLPKLRECGEIESPHSGLDCVDNSEMSELTLFTTVVKQSDLLYVFTYRTRWHILIVCNSADDAFECVLLHELSCISGNTVEIG